MPGLKIKLTPFPENDAVNSDSNSDPEPKKATRDNTPKMESGLPPLKQRSTVKFEKSKKTNAKLSTADLLSVQERTLVRQSLIRDSRALFRKSVAQQSQNKIPRVSFVNSLYPKTSAAGEKIEMEEINAVDAWYEDTGILGKIAMWSLFIYVFCILAMIIVINFGYMTVRMYIFISHTFIVTLGIDVFTSYQGWKIMFSATCADGYVAKMKAAGKLPSKPKARRRTNDFRTSQINSLNPTAQQRKDRASVGLIHASHFYISFLDFLYYHQFCFRIDWTWNAYCARLRHLLIDLATHLGYKTAYRWYAHYSPHYDKPIAGQVAALIMDSSLMLGLTEIDEDAQIATFKYTNWWVPSDIGLSQIMEVNVMMIVIDLESRTCIYCEVNGEEWTDIQEILQIVVLCQSIYYHVLIHLYSNWWYVEDPNHPLHAFGVYTLMTTSISVFFGDFFKTKESARWLFMRNAIRGIHYHHRADLERYSKYSRTARFLLKARPVAKKYCTPENMKTDKVGFESFFIACILHSVDHYMAAQCTNPQLSEYCGPHKMLGAAWIHSMLDIPHREIFVKSSFKNSKLPWVRAMHNELAMIDEEYADMCHLGIRF